MQTFITRYDPNPIVAFHVTAAQLDWRRLGKQRVEAYQIIRALTGESNGWINHPCTKMWRGHLRLLGAYLDTMIDEWERRGYVNTMRRHYTGLDTYPEQWWMMNQHMLPKWYTPEFVHRHQSNLIRKDPTHYGYMFPNVPDDLPYLWGNESLPA
jgi:hypothetical protein